MLVAVKARCTTQCCLSSRWWWSIVAAKGNTGYPRVVASILYLSSVAKCHF